MSASKSYQKNVENQGKDTTGRLMQVLNTCSKMKEVCVVDREDLDENSKWKVSQLHLHFTRLHSMTHNWMFPIFQAAIHHRIHHIPTSIQERAVYNLLHRDFLRELGNISQQSMFGIHHHRRVMFSITEARTKHTQRMRMEVWNDFFLSIDPNFSSQLSVSKNLSGFLFL